MQSISQRFLPSDTSSSAPATSSNAAELDEQRFCVRFKFPDPPRQLRVVGLPVSRIDEHPTNTEFVDAVYHRLPQGAVPLVSSEPATPGTSMQDVFDDLEQQCPPNANNYLNCSSIYPESDELAAFHFLLLDGVGNGEGRKIPPNMAPTWEIETSPDHYQLGFVLTEPLTDYRKATALQFTAVCRYMCDPDAQGGALWARLPNGINSEMHEGNEQEQPTSFVCRLVQWNPDLRYTFEQLVDGLSGNEVSAGQPPSNSLVAREALVECWFERPMANGSKVEIQGYYALREKTADTDCEEGFFDSPIRDFDHRTARTRAASALGVFD